jgi:hypothetical protein
MIELGINIEDQESSLETKNNSVENFAAEENKEVSLEHNDKLDKEESKDEEPDKSIESIPFMSEPVKKKRSRALK